LTLTVQPYDEDDQFFPGFFLVMEHRWNESDGRKLMYSVKKPVPTSLCPPQIPHVLTRLRSRASPCGISGEQSGTETVSRRVLRLLLL
jgi:hypothetical protein